MCYLDVSWLNLEYKFINRMQLQADPERKRMLVYAEMLKQEAEQRKNHERAERE